MKSAYTPSSSFLPTTFPGSNPLMNLGGTSGIMKNNLAGLGSANYATPSSDYAITGTSYLSSNYSKSPYTPSFEYTSRFAAPVSSGTALGLNTLGTGTSGVTFNIGSSASHGFGISASPSLMSGIGAGYPGVASKGLSLGAKLPGLPSDPIMPSSGLLSMGITTNSISSMDAGKYNLGGIATYPEATPSVSFARSPYQPSNDSLSLNRQKSQDKASDKALFTDLSNLAGLSR